MCGNAPKKSSHFQQHFKLVLKSVLNEVFTFIALQTKTWETVGTPFPPTIPCPISGESEILPEPLNAVMYH